ncbi:dihydroorotate dehydrogenase, partial [bacterium]
DAIELNLSCPNVKEGGIHFGRSAETISRLLSELRLITEKPLWAKLSPQVTDIVELGTAAADSGAYAIVVINTLPAMAIDIETKKPRLGAITGGLSGSAIHPVAVAMIYALHNAVDIPIIGVGGISSTEDAIELMLAGATALQIGSSAFADTNLPLKIIDGIGKYCRRQGFSSAREIVGAVEI